MELLPLRLVAIRYIAYAHTRNPRFDPSMSVLVLTEKYLRHSRFRHQYGCGLRFFRSATSFDPQCGQDTPLGQRFSANHASAVALSGNSSASCIKLIPCRKCSPGPFWRGPLRRAPLITGVSYNGTTERLKRFL